LLIPVSRLLLHLTTPAYDHSVPSSPSLPWVCCFSFVSTFVLIHQQLDKSSEGLKKTGKLRKTDIRHSQTTSWSDTQKWVLLISDHQILRLPVILRTSDFQTARLPDCQISDHQIVSYYQTTSYSQLDSPVGPDIATDLQP